MREIKFRAWDDKEISYMEDDIIEPHYNEQLATFLSDHYACDIMQYTGLKDKNGVEIYEGDVLDSVSGAWDIRGKVDFGMWGWQINGYYKEDKNEWCYNFGEIMQCYKQIDHFEDFEIVGNIYENPELLKGE